MKWCLINARENILYMALNGHTFPADFNEAGWSSWTDVVYLRGERISCSHLRLSEPKV
jgi:hypothetical protein